MPAKHRIPHEHQSTRRPEPDNLCQHTDAAGRRCRMPRAAGHSFFCFYHGHREEQDLHAGQIGAEILGVFGELRTATAINHALARLFAALAQNRIPVRRAAVLGYIAQLLQHGLGSVRHETESVIGRNAWNESVRRALDAASESVSASGRDTLAVVDLPPPEE